MRPAPTIDCADCGKPIAKARIHYMLRDADNTVLCIKCMERKTAHSKWYPNCTERWHDMHDHQSSFATRAAAAHILGLWP